MCSQYRISCSFLLRHLQRSMTPDTPSSSGSDTSKPNQRSGDEKLVVTVRIRPLKPDELARVLHAVDNKVK